jgi:isopentenyl diphosphate isomerase/L-lactate dehydrogenase-like FMN-dependent dehydrogenase
LRFLLSSPLLVASLGCSESQNTTPAWPQRELTAAEAQDLIAAASDAINVFDFQAVAQRNLLPAHYTYLSMGVEDEVTLRANRDGFSKFQLRPRRLVDVREVDTSSELLGTRMPSPIILAPVGSQMTYHPDGEVAVARAAAYQDHLQILSMGSSASMDDVLEARGAPVWSQLYALRTGAITKWLLRRAEVAGCSAVVLTVDIVGLPTNRERIERYRRADNPACQPCHQSAAGGVFQAAVGAGRTVGIDFEKMAADTMMLDWDVVDRIRDSTSMKLLIKGILTHEDASLCIEHGIDGIIVSNHGGRAEDNGLTTIEVLPEIVTAVDGRIPILIDSGFRRGTDIFKALALGASAVCIGRPYLWGLAAFGQEGVESVLAILRRELETIMRQMGTPSLGDIDPSRIRFARLADDPTVGGRGS